MCTQSEAVEEALLCPPFTDYTEGLVRLDYGPLSGLFGLFYELYLFI